jgi:hypothetical protein
MGPLLLVVVLFVASFLVTQRTWKYGLTFGSMALAVGIIFSWPWLVEISMDTQRYDQPTQLPFFWMGELLLVVIGTVNLTRFYSQVRQQR